MALKKCPECGKKIAAQACFCIYCSKRLDENMETENAQSAVIEGRSVTSRRKISKQPVIAGVIVGTLSVLIVAAVVLVFMAVFSSGNDSDTAIDTTVSTTTSTTRDPQRDVWLQDFAGRWVDEESVEKKNIMHQGGAMLLIHEIRRDTVVFDLLSYSGGVSSESAFVNNVEALMENDTLHFTFQNDGLGHSGEGYLRFRENAVDLEVLIHTPLDDGAYSLAMNTVFYRLNLPTSSGFDVRSFTTLNEIKAIAGEPIEGPIVNEKNKQTTYRFDMLEAVVLEDGTVKSLCLDYSASEDKSKYCYECVDGTMSYATVKNYFGEAEHDYVEQPTDIRVLHYLFSDKTAVTFTFDAQDNLLIRILYVK